MFLTDLFLPFLQLYNEEVLDLLDTTRDPGDRVRLLRPKKNNCMFLVTDFLEIG